MVEAKIPSYLVASLAIGTPEEAQKQRRLNTLLRDAAVPRQIRVRNAKVPVGQKKRSPESPKTPPSPNQDMAVSNFTKRAALGPWAGPYDSHPDALLPSTLYLDEAGVTYCSLSGTTGTTAKLPLADADRATMEPPRLVAEATKGLVAPRPWPSRSRAAVPRQSGKTWQSGRLSSSAVRRNGAINQPRKS